MAALRTLWAALVSLYDETLVLVLANVAWAVLNVPIFLLLVAVGLPLAGDPAQGGSQWLLVVAAWLLLILPTPGSIALGGVAAIAAGPDAPQMKTFWTTLRQRWRMGLVCCLISTVIAVALLANAYFYAVFSGGWLRFFSIVWVYASLFWLSLHIYLVPLLIHVGEPRVLDIYRRAALLAVGYPLYTLLLLVIVLALGLVSVIFLPAYVLIGGAYASMVQAHAFREIRRRHGDLVTEPEEEVGLR
jgi:uncharacterized membrane protein YesL